MFKAQLHHYRCRPGYGCGCRRRRRCCRRPWNCGLAIKLGTRLLMKRHILHITIVYPDKIPTSLGFLLYPHNHHKIIPSPGAKWKFQKQRGWDQPLPSSLGAYGSYKPVRGWWFGALVDIIWGASPLPGCQWWSLKRIPGSKKISIVLERWLLVGRETTQDIIHFYIILLNSVSSL